MRNLTLATTLSLLIFSISTLYAKVELEFKQIPAGDFHMGTNGVRANYDEAPIHNVVISKEFEMSVTEVTNAMYEEFDPEHKALRGKYGFSTGDNEAVIFVSWHDAMAYCAWLTEREGVTYRLPTEAEWEYAARAGTCWPYYGGWRIPRGSDKNNTEAHNIYISVNLGVKNGAPNLFGLYDIHGNVEEWCLDWYGPYSSDNQIDPVGAASGEFKVTRGGSHSTPVEYLRAGNRMAMIPKDKHHATGFRVVKGEYPLSEPVEQVKVKRNVSQKKHKWTKPTKQSIFLEPIVFINPPKCDSGTPFYYHNHCPAITWLPNGDLLAIWFSTDSEFGREMTILSSRLKAGTQEWTVAEEFYKVPDRNMTGSSLFYDADANIIYHTNGVEALGWWRNLAIAMRKSSDNGATWSMAELIAPEHSLGNQVIAGMFKTKQGYLIQPCDAIPEMNGGSIIHVSRDGGTTWESPNITEETNFTIGNSGQAIAGIHAGVVELKSGDLMALGRTNSFLNSSGQKVMPRSISSNMGKSWSYHATDLPYIGGGQRVVLRRLDEGPLLLISFTSTSHSWHDTKWGMEFDRGGERKFGYGMYAALSYDEGETWTKRRLLTDGVDRYLDGGAWTGHFFTSDFQAEPKGYIAATQTPDGMIHLISSRIHYRFNLAWLEE